jgi:hypothetical protein
MAFTGDLEHLPIVDVIQLLHATRKSGILRVKSRKGESQLVFKEGFIVSANHLDSSVRIGKILIDNNIITPELLDQTLVEQENAGHERKPLIVTLIERGLVNEKDAYKGLEQLIEMTVVEILTWKKGTFTLDVLPKSVADGYKYFPEKMNQEINVDTQGILMNALRIFDEKMRDGELQEEDYSEDALLLEETVVGEESPQLSADDLGLAGLEFLEKKLPEVHAVLEDWDPYTPHRLKLEKIAPELSLPEREALVTFLGKISVSSNADRELAHQEGQAQPVLFFSCDELLEHSVKTVCKHVGIPVFAANEEQNLDHIIDQSLAKNRLPILVLDSPGSYVGSLSTEQTASLGRQKKEKYPQICVMQLASSQDTDFVLHSYKYGVRAVLPKPSREAGKENYVENVIHFLQTFQSYVLRCAEESGSAFVGKLRNSIMVLRELREAPDVALVLLQFVARMFERSVTLIVRESELVAERGIGVKADKSRGATPAMGFRIPLGKPTLFREVIEEGGIFYGNTDDAVIREYLFPAIGAPGHSSILLLPLRMRGKTISLTYGDFGSGDPALIEIDLLEILANHAELTMDNSIYRKTLEKHLVKG